MSRKNNLCKNGHLVTGKNVKLKSGYLQCRQCIKEREKKYQNKSPDLPAPISSKREDDLTDPTFTPNGELTYYYNLRNGNRKVSPPNDVWSIDNDQD